MVVLTALLRLRQICCDLRLLKSVGRGNLFQAKWNCSTNCWKKFSTAAIARWFSASSPACSHCCGKNCRRRQIGFCYLDGSTTDRARVVDQFQRDADVPVFLISLKAGGVGLNLTGADTVIHFDPWWNPAVEAQATDRAHRLGQKKVVTSYKLIARGTVEEKILSLQTRKRALTQGLLGGEESLAEALNWEDIRELLEI